MARETKGPSAGLAVADQPGIYFFLVASAAGFYLLVTTWLSAVVAAFLGSEPVPGLGGWLQSSLSYLTSLGSEHPLPGVSKPIFVGSLVAVQLVTLTVSIVVVVLIKERIGLRAGVIGTPAALKELSRQARLDQARRLRPSLRERSDKEILGSLFGEIGFNFGVTQRGSQQLYSGLEDQVVAIMGPRSGKTAALAIPQIIGAAGPVISTTNKEDVWAISNAERTRRTGERSWTFDPQQIAYAEPDWFWNPLRGVTSYARAAELAQIFLPPNPKAGANKFFDDAANAYLTLLVLAASLASEPSMELVRDWLIDPADDEPLLLLNEDPKFAYLAKRLAKYVHADSDNGRLNNSVIETAKTGCACLNDPSILAWIIPDPRKKEFGVREFLDSRQTLYLLSRSEGAITAGPIITAFVNELFLAANNMPDRMDPPLTVVLDEAANIVRIPGLPKYYSYAGSKGILITTILQNYAQAEEVWGDEGARQLWSSAAIRLIGAGISDVKFADQVSQLIGSHQVDYRSVSRGERHSVSVSTQDKPIMEVSDIRELKSFTAVLLVNGLEPATIELIPWFSTDSGEQLGKDAEAANRQVAEAARTVGIYG